MNTPTNDRVPRGVSGYLTEEPFLESTFLGRSVEAPNGDDPRVIFSRQGIVGQSLRERFLDPVSEQNSTPPVMNRKRPWEDDEDTAPPRFKKRPRTDALPETKPKQSEVAFPHLLDKRHNPLLLSICQSGGYVVPPRSSMWGFSLRHLELSERSIESNHRELVDLKKGVIRAICNRIKWRKYEVNEHWLLVEEMKEIMGRDVKSLLSKQMVHEDDRANCMQYDALSGLLIDILNKQETLHSNIDHLEEEDQMLQEMKMLLHYIATNGLENKSENYNILGKFNFTYPEPIDVDMLIPLKIMGTVYHFPPLRLWTIQFPCGGKMSIENFENMLTRKSNVVSAQLLEISQKVNLLTARLIELNGELIKSED